MQKMKKIDINLCFKEAWKGFKGWWIPLCIVSAAIMISQISIPKKIVGKELEVLKPYEHAYTEFKTGVSDQPSQFFQLYKSFIINCSEISTDKKIILAFIHLLMKITIVIGIIVCILNVIMIVIAKAAVEPDKKKRTIRRDLSRGIFLSFSYIILSFVKVIPFFFCIVPGIYVYCKLYFTGFIITDESANPISAMTKSWKMTNGNFIEVMIIFLVTIVVNVVSVLTVVGIIPGTSYNYTLRAAAYRQLKN